MNSQTSKSDGFSKCATQWKRKFLSLKGTVSLISSGTGSFTDAGQSLSEMGINAKYKKSNRKVKKNIDEQNSNVLQEIYSLKQSPSEIKKLSMKQNCNNQSLTIEGNGNKYQSEKDISLLKTSEEKKNNLSENDSKGNGESSDYKLFTKKNKHKKRKIEEFSNKNQSVTSQDINSTKINGKDSLVGRNKHFKNEYQKKMSKFDFRNKINSNEVNTLSNDGSRRKFDQVSYGFEMVKNPTKKCKKNKNGNKSFRKAHNQLCSSSEFNEINSHSDFKQSDIKIKKKHKKADGLGKPSDQKRRTDEELFSKLNGIGDNFENTAFSTINSFSGSKIRNKGIKSKSNSFLNEDIDCEGMKINKVEGHIATTKLKSDNFNLKNMKSVNSSCTAKNVHSKTKMKEPGSEIKSRKSKDSFINPNSNESFVLKNVKENKKRKTKSVSDDGEVWNANVGELSISPKINNKDSLNARQKQNVNNKRQSRSIDLSQHCDINSEKAKDVFSSDTLNASESVELVKNKKTKKRKRSNPNILNEREIVKPSEFDNSCKKRKRKGSKIDNESKTFKKSGENKYDTANKKTVSRVSDKMLKGKNKLKSKSHVSIKGNSLVSEDDQDNKCYGQLQNFNESPAYFHKKSDNFTTSSPYLEKSDLAQKIKGSEKSKKFSYLYSNKKNRNEKKSISYLEEEVQLQFPKLKNNKQNKKQKLMNSGSETSVSVSNIGICPDPTNKSSSFTEECSSGWMEISDYPSNIVMNNSNSLENKWCESELSNNNDVLMEHTFESVPNSMCFKDNCNSSSDSDSEIVPNEKTSAEVCKIDSIQLESSLPNEQFSDLSISNSQISKLNHCCLDEINGACEISKYFKITEMNDGKVLFFMPPNSTLNIEGIVNVTVYRGCLEILGHRTQLEKKFAIYSLRGFGILSLMSCESSQCGVINKSSVSEKLIQMGASRFIIENELMNTNYCSVFVLERAESWITSAISIQIPMELCSSVPKRTSDKRSRAKYELQCYTLDLKHTNSEYRALPDWECIAEKFLSDANLKDQQKFFVAGGKGVGKSTFLRYLVNRSLQKFPVVLYIDLDPGQPEFSLPGSISAVLVRHPLLGPNFTHVETPERLMFISTVNVSDCANHYLECVINLIEVCKENEEFRKIPWFVNTMGFCSGLGLELMINIIQNLKPTHMLQIIHNNKKFNFPFVLDCEFVKNYTISFGKTCASKESLDYSINVLESAVKDSICKFPPKLLREIMTLSYFNKLVSPPNYSILDVTPYKIHLSKLKLCCKSSSVLPSQVLRIINGNLVALFHYEGESVFSIDENFPEILLDLPVKHCLGFGIVRGIDSENKYLYLLTPVSEQVLSEVNCLVAGTGSVPNCMRIKMFSGFGQIPYITYGEGQPTSRVVHEVEREQHNEDNKQTKFENLFLL